MRKYIFPLSGFLFLLVFISSCRKVIDIDLNSTNAKIVIEANISDEAGPYTVKLTKTVNFSEANNFPAVSGALVKISDDAGNSEFLTETSTGIYITNGIQGIPGRTYTLEVVAEEETYISVSKMPVATNIDSLAVQESFFGNRKLVYVYFKDSAGVTNQYRFVQVVNDAARNDMPIMDDSFQDGENLQFAFFGGEDSLSAGDSVKVFLQSIDKGAYEYFRTLALLTGDGGGPPSDTPANPISNISNGALGYFSTYAVRSNTIVIQ